MKIYDMIVVGAGPAGITAAIYAARKKLEVLVITKNIGGWAAFSGDIENYTGFQYITGPEIAEKFEHHLKNFKNIEVIENEEVSCVNKEGDLFIVNAKKGQYKAKTAILAPGRKPRLLGVPGEEEFKNKGVTYCATCDGPLFSGKDVAVVGGGNSALDSTMQLMKIANKVYVITINDRMIGDEVMIEKVNQSENVEIITKAITKEVTGDGFVDGLRIELPDGKDRRLDVQGIFVEIGSVPVTTPACNMVKMNKFGEILVNEKCETNISGLFAAGDVTNVPYKQIIVASGHGCIASLSAFDYLSRSK